MKPVVIIAIAVVCSVAAVLSIQFLFNSGNEILGDNIITGSLFFDCAKEFDKMIRDYDNPKMNNYDESIQYQNTLYNYGFELFENRCLITIESWAYKSNYENRLWDMPWRDLSYYNQIVLGEIQCHERTCQNMKKIYDENKALIEEQGVLLK